MNSQLSLWSTFASSVDGEQTTTTAGSASPWLLILLIMAGFCVAMVILFTEESEPIPPAPAYTLSRTCTTCGESLKLTLHAHQDIPEERWRTFFLRHGWVLTDAEAFCHKHRVPASKTPLTPQATSLTITAPDDVNITVNIEGNRS